MADRTAYDVQYYSIQGGPKKTAHGVCGDNFVSLSTLNIFS